MYVNYAPERCLTLLHKPPFDAVLWWEKRRLLFNLVLLPVGLATVAAIEFAGGFSRAGEDATEPMGLLFGVAAYALAANCGYTLGWITELLWSGGDTEFTKGTAAAYSAWVCFSLWD